MTPAQDHPLRRLTGKSLALADWDDVQGCYIHMPYRREQRTYEALARRDTVRYVTIDQGYKYNGYILTAKGRTVATKKGYMI